MIGTKRKINEYREGVLGDLVHEAVSWQAYQAEGKLPIRHYFTRFSEEFTGIKLDAHYLETARERLLEETTRLPCGV